MIRTAWVGVHRKFAPETLRSHNTRQERMPLGDGGQAQALQNSIKPV